MCSRGTTIPSLIDVVPKVQREEGMDDSEVVASLRASEFPIILDFSVQVWDYTYGHRESVKDPVAEASGSDESQRYDE